MAHDPDRTSYFPAVEKKYGKPMSHWFAQMKKVEGLKYPEQMAFLQEQHGFSRAHANALVLYSRGSVSARRFGTLEEYLASIDPLQAKTVQNILKAITSRFKDLETVIAWNQPMLKSGSRYVFGISATKGYLLIAPYDAKVIEQFRTRLSDYVVNKKTIRVPSDWKVDKALLRDMIDASLR